jgi:outer membrane protein assembly factor BamB
MKKLFDLIVLGLALGLIISGCEKLPNSVEHPSSEQNELSTMMKIVQAGSVELEMCVSYDSETETYIFSLAVYGGKLYAGTAPGGNIYVLDGTAWSLAFNTETETHVWSLAVYDNKLYAGTEPGGLVYVYDGTSWSLAFDSPEYHINSLAVYDGKLYAGTWNRGKIYVYDGNSWSEATDVFTILSDPGIEFPDYLSHVFALVEYNGNLYAGTDVFTYTPGPAGPLDPSGGLIFVYDGSSWSLALDTDEDQIRSLAVYDGKLFAGTYPSGKIYVFDGTSWGITFDGPAKSVYSLAVYNDNLYAGTTTPGVIYGFDGSQWVTAFDSQEKAVFSLASYAESFYAGTSDAGRIYGPCEIIIDIDIKPGSYPNSINCRNENGVITVAILTTNEFNATNVDHTTVYFGKNGTEASEIHVDKKTDEQKRHEKDIDGDGDIDLIFYFRFGDTGIECGDEEAILTGETFDGQKIKGSDNIRTVGN